MDSVTQGRQASQANQAELPSEVAGVIQVDAGKIQGYLDQKVRESVEQTLNMLLDEEADRACGAKRYEHSPERSDTRAGHYSRKLLTKAGEVALNVPRLRKLPLETAIIERYRRRESSVEEALMEMYLAGVSVRRGEDITEALWGTRVSPSVGRDLNQKIYGQNQAWRDPKTEGGHAYLCLGGLWLKRSWGGEVKNVAVLVAIGVDQEGYREVLGVAEGGREDAESWLSFLRHLKQRGLSGVKLFISDKCLGLVESVSQCFPEAAWQRCVVHFYRNVFTVTPRGKAKAVAAMLKAIHAQEDKPAAQEKAQAVVAKLRELKLGQAAEIVEQGVGETLSYYAFPREHWRCLRTNNPLERLNREIRRRTRVVGNFPDGHSALMLVAARLRHVAGTKWGTRRYLDMSRLREPVETLAAVA
jgi:putative transposase